VNIHAQFKSTLQALACLQASSSSEATPPTSEFDHWILVQINEPMKTKVGLSFDKGELTIAKPGQQFGVDMFGNSVEKMLVWSFKNQRVVLVPSQHTSTLEGECSTIRII